MAKCRCSCQCCKNGTCKEDKNNPCCRGCICCMDEADLKGSFFDKPQPMDKVDGPSAG